MVSIVLPGGKVNLPSHKQRQSEQSSKKWRQDQLISELISPEGAVVHVHTSTYSTYSIYTP